MEHDSIFIVTGANGQIGKSITKILIENKNFVFAIDIKRDNSLHYPSEFYSFHKVDISKIRQVEKIFSKIFKINPNNKTMHLINNAGVATFDDFSKRKNKDFDNVFNVNLKGTFNTIKQFAYESEQNPRRSKHNSIVNIGSIFGLVSPDLSNYVDLNRKSSEIYGATKAGIIQMTKYFAVALSKLNIRVNCVSPGGIFNPETPQGPIFIEKYSSKVPMGRMGKAEEIAGPILFLCSQNANYINGHNLVVDGGLTSW